MRNKFVFILAIWACSCWAQVGDVIPSSRNTANIQTARTDIWTAFQNPASLIQKERWQVAMQYENKYLMAKLNCASVQAGYCNKYVNVGVSYSFFGYSKYQEMMAGVTLARAFGRFSIGIQGNYLGIYCGDDLGYRGTFIPEIGATCAITTKWTIGIHTYNPFIQTLKVDDEYRRKLPAIYSIGSDYHFHPQLRWGVQVDYDVATTYRIATSIEWQAIDELQVKIGGYYYEQFVGCLGLGVFYKGLRIDCNFSYNPKLGLSCQGGISYSL